MVASNGYFVSLLTTQAICYRQMACSHLYIKNSTNDAIPTIAPITVQKSNNIWYNFERILATLLRKNFLHRVTH